jgi:hypothetical protein
VSANDVFFKLGESYEPLVTKTAFTVLVSSGDEYIEHELPAGVEFIRYILISLAVYILEHQMVLKVNYTMNNLTIPI